MTQEEFIEKAKEIHGDKYDYSKVIFINKTTNVCIICPEHGEFWQLPYKHLSGRGCFRCGVLKIKEKLKYTNEKYIEKARKRHGSKYDYSKVEYVNNYTKICIICPEHGEFYVLPQEHLGMVGCPICGESYVGTNKLSNIEEFTEKAKKVHGNKYDYSKAKYINTKTKLCIICPEHGEFWQLPYKHLSGQGCPFCAGKIKYTTESFIEKCTKLEHTKDMTFEKVDYVNSNTKVKIICHHKDEKGIEHGEFLINPMKLLSGQGCPKCRYIKSATRKRRNLFEIINFAKEIHGDRYDYSLITEYKNDRVKYPIICPEHGIFEQSFNNHIKSKQGCPICGRIKCDETRTMSQKEFIEKAKKIHHNRYDYSKVDYKKTNVKVCIICPEHGEFWQQPNNHLFGQGCPKCYRDKSKIERELFDFIKEILTEDIVVEENNRIILEGKEIDVYIPSKKVGFEMNGLIWHSDKFNTEINYHLNKTLKCLEKGVHLIHIFEDEWLNKKEICKDLIKKTLGIIKNNINLELTEIKEINDDNIVFNFLEENDLKGYIKTDINIGLYLNNELIELISFKKIYNSDYEIVRHCYKLEKYKEENSRLIQYFIEKYNPDNIFAFVDISKEKDFKYKDLDFFFEKEIKPDYYFVNAKKRFNKEDNIENEEVCKIYDCGYFQYKWTK